MKILAFVDLHASTKALEEIKKKAKDVDLIVCAGDISIFGNKVDQILSKLSKIKKRILMIHGNHEDEEDFIQLCKKYDNIINIHGKMHQEGDHFFIGWGGGGFSSTDEEFESYAKSIENKIKDKKTVLVVHAPPYKTKLDDIMGSPCGNRSFKNWVKKNKPSLLFAGHIHENAGKQDSVGPSKLVNPGPTGKIIHL